MGDKKYKVRAKKVFHSHLQRLGMQLCRIQRRAFFVTSPPFYVVIEPAYECVVVTPLFGILCVVWGQHWTKEVFLWYAFGKMYRWAFACHVLHLLHSRENPWCILFGGCILNLLEGSTICDSIGGCLRCGVHGANKFSSASCCVRCTVL